MIYNELSVGSLLGDVGAYKVEGTTVPSDGSVGYAPGCIFVKTNAGQDGNPPLYVNFGTQTSSKFRVMSVIPGWSISAGAVDVPCTSGNQVLPAPNDFYGKTTSDPAFGGFTTTDDVDTVVELTTNEVNTQITFNLSADPLSAHKVGFGLLQQGVLPAFVCTHAGKQATVANADSPPKNTVTVSGAAVGDLAFACFNTTDDTDQVTGAKITASDTMTVTMTANPLTAHNITYAVFAPVGRAIPSYYVSHAGLLTSGSGNDGGATEVFTISGITTADYAIVQLNNKGATPVTLKSANITGSDSLTIAASGDPSNDHIWSYMILRAI